MNILIPNYKRKYYYPVLSVIFLVILKSQVIHAEFHISKTYSPNHKFYIICTPYDDVEPSLSGKAEIYNEDNKLIYSFTRGFNGNREDGNEVALSDDGNTVISIIRISSFTQLNDSKSVLIYRKGILIKSFTQTQITGCDPKNDHCELIYYNGRIIDRAKSWEANKVYHKVFNEGTPDDEIFLADHAVAQVKNRLFLTDPKKVTHIIDLEKADTLSSVPFADIYPKIKYKAADSLTSYQSFATPYPTTKSKFPNLINGESAADALAKKLGLKAVYINDDKNFSKYRIYYISISALISRDGSLEIEKIEADKKLPLDTITHFFKNNRYDVSFLPAQLDKWCFNYFFCEFRNASDEQAMAEKAQDEKDKILERDRRITMDSIAGVYIPRNLTECFIQLDKMLPPVTKNDMMAFKKPGDMLQYHFTLGMWIRNNWGLWGGSRLVTYFKNNGVMGIGKGPDPETISTIILYSYYDWLKGDKNAGIKWEMKAQRANHTTISNYHLAN